VHSHEHEIQQEAAPEAPAPPTPAVEHPSPDAVAADPMQPADPPAADASTADASELSAASQEEADADEGAEAIKGVEAVDGEVEAEGDPAALRERAAKADEYLALAQRTQADFENFRKRMMRDVRAAEARGMSRLARELLPALDNLDRAIAAVEASDGEDEHHLTKGIRLVQSELASALARTGIEAYATKGELFDPVHHEAVAQTPVEGAEPGSIVEVLQAGYRLNELVLRPARVVVAG
jgi:molecular chaperone GrpE